MTPSSDLQEKLRRYLLGQVDAERLEEIEQEFLLNDDIFDELLGAEDALVDDYLNESLSAKDRAAFEKHFRSTPEREELLKFGRTFHRHLSRQFVSSPSAIQPDDSFPRVHTEAAESQPRRTEVQSPVWWSSARTFFSSPWRAAAFAILVLAVGLGVWAFFHRQSAVDEGLLALNSAYREQRPIESRISRFDYAPYVVTRGPGDERVHQEALRRAELTLLNEQEKHPTSAARHALGKVYLAKKDFDQAIKQFDEALKSDPNNAQIYSDLGAAWLEKGKIEIEGNRVADLARSLGYLNNALEMDNNLLAALFNRALCRQELALWDQAQNDWQEYLKRDSQSLWADEARRNLKLVEERRKTISQDKKQIFQTFLEQFKSGDDAGAWRSLSSNHDRSGNVIVDEFADAFLNAASNNDGEAESQQLKGLTYVADLENKRASDRFFSDLVRFYASTNSHQKLLISQGRVLMKLAHRGWGESLADESLASFRQARDLFEQAGDVCEVALTEYWLSFCYYRKLQEAQSSILLKSLLAMCQAKRYQWLQVRVLYLLAALHFDLNEHSKAIDFASHSLALAEDTNDAVGELNAAISLMEYYRYLGNYEKSLACMEKSLPLVSSISMDPVQGTRVYGFQAQSLAYARFYSAAADYQSQALRLALATGNVSMITQNYIFLAAVNGELGKFAAAIQNAQQAYDTAAAHSNEAADRELMGIASLQMGDFYRRQKIFSAALVQYDRSLKISEELKQPIDLYQAHKGKLYCFIATGDDRQAKTEITQALSLAEQYRNKIFEENNRENFFQAEQSLYDLAIDFEYSRMKDPQEALRLSEMCRGRSLLDLIHSDARVWKVGANVDLVSSRAVPSLTPDEIRSRMPDNAQILQYAVLKKRLIIWVISKDKVLTVPQEISAEELTSDVNAFQNLTSSPSSDITAITALGRKLFRLVIEPAQPLLDSHKVICIVPDKSLNFLPFAALTSSSGHFLFEDYVLLFSPASSAFIFSSESARKRENVKSEKLLSVGNPAFDRKAFPSLTDLPSAGKEAAEISSYYGSPRVLIGSDATVANVKNAMVSADVIHLATHSSLNERFPLRSEFLLAKGPGASDSESALPAFEIYQLNLQRPRLVILSACQTGAERYRDGEGMISLVRPFLVARIPLVIASSWPVDSEATRQLMLRFHEHRTVGGLSTLEAFQRSQKEMLTLSDGQYASPYYWAAFMTIGGYAKF